MMSSTVPSKRTRLSEPEQTQNQNQQNSQFTNTQLRPMFHQNQNQNQHQHQLIPGEFVQSSQVQQQQQQQQQQQITTSQQDPELLLTNQDIQRLQRGFDFLLETIVPNKSQQAKDAFTNMFKSSLNSTNNKVTHRSNTVVLDIPVLTELTHKETVKAASPLSRLLNHTYQSSIVELVEKLSRISLNPSDLSGNSSTPIVTNNFTNNVSPASADDPSSKAPIPPPSRELCQQLIQEYFTHFNIMLPVLDRRRFIDHWRNENTKHSQLLVTATLSLAASRYSDDPSIQKTPDKPGGVFFDSAKKLLDMIYDTPRLETVQALILLTHSSITVSRLESAYMFLGMAVQMANALNIERDSSNLLPEEDEERRRVFYCVYCCDRWLSFTLGKPYAIDDININAQLPTLPSFEQPARNFFIAFVKLSRILGQIWKFGYSSQPKATQSTWIDHVSDNKSMLRQIRAALAKWLKDLPDDLQYQYLPNTDIRSLFQLARFSVYAGYINILFHICIILLHQPYLTQAYDNPKIEANQGPIKTCLTAATTITDIAKTTRQFDKKSFCSFQYPIYGILQSAIVELVIMNGSADHAQDAKKALNDTINELRWIGEHANYVSLLEIVKELESIMMITNGSTDGNHLSIPLPFVIQMLEQSNNTQKSSSAVSANNDNNTISNKSTRNQYSDNNFNSTDVTKEDYPNSNEDNSTNSESTLNELRPNLTNASTNKDSSTLHLQNQSQVQLQQRNQLQNQQITHQSNMFMIPPTFNTSPPQTPASTSLHQQYHHLPPPFDANDNNHQPTPEISPQSGNSQWDDSFYVDNEFLFDNVNTTNVNGTTVQNHVMDDLSSIYPGFNTYTEMVGPQ